MDRIPMAGSPRRECSLLATENIKKTFDVKTSITCHKCLSDKERCRYLPSNGSVAGGLATTGGEPFPG